MPDLSSISGQIEQLENAYTLWNSWAVRFTAGAAICAILAAVCAVEYFLTSYRANNISRRLNEAVKKESRLKDEQRQTEIAMLNLDVAKAQKEVEQEKIARLKIEEKVAPRRLTKEQQETIARKLSPLAGEIINVLIYRGDVEAWFLADQIKIALGGATGAGWIVHSATVTEFNRAFSGIVVETTLRADPKTVSAAKALVSVLSAEKLVVRGPSPVLESLRFEAFGKLSSEAGIHLVVGNKP